VSQQDPLANFLGDLAKKIKVTKEHKDIMEAVYASVSATEIVKEQDDPFAGFLQKVGKALSEKIPIKENIEKPKESLPLVVEIVKPVEKIPEPGLTENEPVKSLAYKIKEAIEKAKTRALNGVSEPAQENNEEKPKADEPEDEQIATYISELEKIKDTGTVQQKEEAITSLKELKEYVDKTVKDYSRRILDLGSGGGTVAVQYANGGTMNGDLNINGHILSGGRNISDYFGTGGGGGSGDPAVNSLVHINSGFWNEAYTNLVTNSAGYLLSGTDVYLGDIPVLSGNWNSNFTTTNYFSAFWNAAVDELFNFYVTQTDPGSAFISEDGNYYIIANSKLDNVNLWNTAYTQIFLLSSRWDSVYVTVLGNSARWESVYNTFNQNSARYESAFNTTQTLSTSWSSVYNTYRSLSASYATETLAIAYAVAL